MTKKPSKRHRDGNQLAKSIVDIAMGERSDRDPTPEVLGKTRPPRPQKLEHNSV